MIHASPWLEDDFSWEIISMFNFKYSFWASTSRSFDSRFSIIRSFSAIKSSKSCFSSIAPLLFLKFLVVKFVIFRLLDFLRLLFELNSRHRIQNRHNKKSFFFHFFLRSSWVLAWDLWIVSNSKLRSKIFWFRFATWRFSVERAKFKVWFSRFSSSSSFLINWRSFSRPSIWTLEVVSEVTSFSSILAISIVLYSENSSLSRWFSHFSKSRSLFEHVNKA